MQTDPEYYEGKLSEETANQRTALENRLDELYAKLEPLTGIERLKALRDLNVLEQQLAWQGANPKALPFDELREHIHAGRKGGDVVEHKYAARIRNRATAMRAYCVECQGGLVVGVKECAAVTCPLHPFRMGGDPFRGYELPKPVYEPELPDDEEDVGEFEEDDDDEADETTTLE